MRGFDCSAAGPHASSLEVCWRCGAGARHGGLGGASVASEACTALCSICAGAETTIWTVLTP